MCMSFACEIGGLVDSLALKVVLMVRMRDRGDGMSAHNDIGSISPALRLSCLQRRPFGSIRLRERLPLSFERHCTPSIRL